MRAPVLLLALISCAAREGPPVSLHEHVAHSQPEAPKAVPVHEGVVVNPLAIVHAERLSRWKAAAIELKGAHPTRDLRMTVCGQRQSRIASALRERLEEHFGLGGARWVSPVGHSVREFGSLRRKGKWTANAGALTTRDRGARLTLEMREPFSRIEVLADAQPAGGSLRIRIDGSYDIHMATDGARGALAEVTRDVPEAPHAIEIVSTGDGPINLRAIIVDRQTVGVSVFEVGCDLPEYAPKTSAFLSDVDLWVLRAPAKHGAQSYESSLLSMGRAWMKRYPSASCLLVRGDRKRQAFSEVETRVADALSCALVDPDEALVRVVDDPRQLRDGKVRDRLVGQLLATDLASVHRPDFVGNRFAMSP